MDSTEKEVNIPEVRNRLSPKRPDRCIFGFENFLPRQYRQSIYSQNDGIQESCIVNKEKALIGRDTTSGFKVDPRPLYFSYDKPVNPEDLNNS